MNEIPVYSSEAADGLSEEIKKNSSIAYLVPLKSAKVDEEDKEVVNKFLAESNDKTINSATLYQTKSVLVTSNWNKNDDVFSVAEIWNARNTPVHQPTNIDHDHNKIVGHITDCWVIDSEGNTLEDDTDLEDLPDVIHICNGAVIYKRYKEEDLTDRASDLIEQIEADEKFVSMECLFPDFDYAVITPEGENYTIARNDETSFLTKHLRIYGGEGSYKGYKVGRLLKSMVFSGKGYVDKPANSESIIFTEDKPDFNFSAASYKETFDFKNGVDTNVSEILKVSASVNNSREKNMSEINNDFLKEELATVKEQLAESVKANKALQTSLADVNVEQYKIQIASLTEQVTSLEKSKEEGSVKLDESKASVNTLTETLKEITESKEALETKINEAKAEKTFADRVSTLVDNGQEKTEAEAIVEKFKSLDDEQFAAISDVYAKNAEEVKEEVEAEAGDIEKTLEKVEVEGSEASVGSVEADDEINKLEEARAAALSSAINDVFNTSSDK